jgi:hypothetical protein
MAGVSPVSMKVADSIAAYRIVRVTSAETVALCTALTDVPFGVTQDNSNAATQAVPVAIHGICRVYFNDSVAAGGLVGTDSSGRAVPYVVLSTGSYSVGTLIGAKVNATGAVAEILLRPGFTTSNA